MGKVGDRLRELVALVRLMQPMGKLRLGALGGYAFIFLIILGTLSGYMCLGYILSCLAVVILVIALFVLYVILQL